MTTTEIGFVKVDGTLEPEALAGRVAEHVHRRIGEFLVLSERWLAEDGMELSERQRIGIAGTASRVFDGIEAYALRAITEATEVAKREAS